MPKIVIVAEKDEALERLAGRLSQAGYNPVFSTREKVISQIGENPPDAVLMRVTDTILSSGMTDLSRLIKEAAPVPVIALVTGETLSSLSPEMLWDDFVIMPCDGQELILRVRRLLGNGKEAEGTELIRSGDLVIDLAQYNVLLAGKKVELTYREYELLRFLMSNRGRVFTREALMDRVWGYDYYGGDRTVDVHIRRLRSKIESDGYSFIETVRNIGYRFRDGT